MQMKNKLYVCFIALLFVTVIFVVAEQITPNTKELFVIKKKDSKQNNKRQSKSKLQEELCERLADQLNYAIEIYKSIADIQEVILKRTREYLEHSKNGFILTADKNKLESCLKLSQKFTNDLEKFVQNCDSYKKYLHNLV